MKIRRFLLAVGLLATWAVLAVNVAVGATQTLTGMVTDDMCGKKHTMMPGKTDAECVRACVRAGSKYVLLVGDKMYVLKGDAKQIDSFAGKRVSVNGEVSGNAVSVASISVAK